MSKYLNLYVLSSTPLISYIKQLPVSQISLVRLAWDVSIKVNVFMIDLTQRFFERARSLQKEIEKKKKEKRKELSEMVRETTTNSVRARCSK